MITTDTPQPDDWWRRPDRPDEPRTPQQGVIATYVHAGGRIGAMVELGCETDFIARSEDLHKLAHDLALQVAAMAPRYITLEEAGIDVEVSSAQILLKQPFIKDPASTVEQLILEAMYKVGEQIRIRRVVRFEVGVEKS